MPRFSGETRAGHFVLSAALLLSIPRFCLAADDALAVALRDGDLSERIRAVGELGKTGGARGPMLQALADPDWQVRLNAVSWMGRRGQEGRAALESLLVSEACPLVRMSAVYWLARLGREPEAFSAERSGEDLRGCESWVGPIARDYPRVPGQKTDLAVVTPSDGLGCFYARFKRPGSAACPGGAIVTGTGASPQAPDFLSDESAVSGVALCCPPGRDLAAGKGIVPERRTTDCHLMPEKCPAGWVEMEPGRRSPVEPSDASWVECCPQSGAFQALPPQRPARIPVCTPNTRIEWLALGIEREDGCEPYDPNCGIKVKEDDAPPPAEPLWEPPPLPKRQSPKKSPQKGAPLPSPGLIAGRGQDPGEMSAPIAALLDGLKSKAAQERERSALALAGMGPRAFSSAAGLEPVLKGDPSPRVRAYAALALASVTRGNDAAVSLLQEALSDPSPGVRYSAAQALGRIGTPRALEAFLLHTRAEATKFIGGK
ncbi:MAG: HEAT repeat domain-containing protein [Elusimicrobia bacterium]|nr:HEAT repeat domain-containing protein [Elusimicrobiota bacterium]